MGDLSNLLLEIFQAPDVDLAASWREPLKPGDVRQVGPVVREHRAA